MSISVTCKCGKRLKAKDELAGKRVRCPGCGKAIVLSVSPDSKPNVQARSQTNNKAGSQARNTRTAGSNRRPHNPRLQRHSSNKLFWILGGTGVASVIAIMIVLFSLQNDDNGNSIGENNPDTERNAKKNSEEKLISMLTDLESLIVEPGEIGPEWRFSNGKRPSVHFGCNNISMIYDMPDKILGLFLIAIRKSSLVDNARHDFESKTHWMKKGDASGPGEESRIHIGKRGEFSVYFIRRNVVVQIMDSSSQGSESCHKIAKIIDQRIKKNLKMVPPPKTFRKRNPTDEEIQKAREELIRSHQSK